MHKIESADITDLGTIKVVIAGGINRSIREDVLEIGKRAMLPIQVFYRMPDGEVVGEGQGPQNEWIQDYYKTVVLPNFVGTPSDAPPEQVAAEPKGALKLRRVRSKKRGRPVVAWRLGDDELRVGTRIKFNKEAALQWSMNRTLNVRPGATATVNELSTRRPVAFIRIGGEYDNIELPIHMMGHLFNLDSGPKLKESTEGKRKDSSLTPEFMKTMAAIGWGRDQEKDDVPGNSPFDRDRWQARALDTLDDEYEESVDEDEMLVLDPDDAKQKPVKNQKTLILSKR